jgi:hypothetical protein
VRARRRRTERRGGGVLEGKGEWGTSRGVCRGSIRRPADDVDNLGPLVRGCVALMEVWEDAPRRFWG